MGLLLEAVYRSHVEVPDDFVFLEYLLEVRDPAGECFHLGQEALEEASVGLDGMTLQGAPLHVHANVRHVFFGGGTNLSHGW